MKEGERVMSFQWLIDYNELAEEVARIDYKLDREKRELKRWVEGDLQDVRLTNESIAAKIEERIEKMEWELAHKMNDLYKLDNLIATFKGLDNRIVYKRYVECKSLIEIAEELSYSYSYIKSKHAEIVRMINFAEKVL